MRDKERQRIHNPGRIAYPAKGEVWKTTENDWEAGWALLCFQPAVRSGAAMYGSSRGCAGRMAAAASC